MDFCLRIFYHDVHSRHKKSSRTHSSIPHERVHISAGQLRHQRCYIAWREHNIILSVIFDMYPVSQRVENFPSKIKVQIALQTRDDILLHLLKQAFEDALAIYRSPQGFLFKHWLQKV